MKISERLKKYKEIKTKIEATEARIDAYRAMIEEGKFKQMGSLSGDILLERELTAELVKQWIDEDRTSIRLLKIEVMQIEYALRSLTPWEAYVIRSKYIENLSWAKIELSFNKEYPEKKYLTYDRIRQIGKGALQKMEAVLTPFYRQMNLNIS